MTRIIADLRQRCEAAGHLVDWVFGTDRLFLDSYGVARDDGRMAFYRLLYDLVA